MLRLLIIPAVLIALLAGAFLWSGETNLGRADFTFVNRGDHFSLDPNDMSYMQDIRLAYALWEGLYTLDPQTLQPVPGTAETIDVSPDQLVYTFHLRKNARWSNGDPVVAGDFAFEWKRTLQDPGDYTHLHHYIKGAEQYETAYGIYAKAPAAEKHPEPSFETVGEKVLDDNTFQVTLEHPVLFFPALCAFPAFFPLNQRSMEPFLDTKSLPYKYDPGFTRPPHLVTNGPFKLTDWQFHRRVRLTASDYYWDKANVGCKTIDELYVQPGEAMAGYRLYQQGTVDWIADVDPELAAPLLKQKRPDLQVFTAFGTSYYDLNCLPVVNGKTNPLVDPRVRRALAMSIDKTAIVRDIARLGQPVATTYIPPGVFTGYESPKGLPFDVAAAKKELADAGYPDGAGFPQIAVLYDTGGLQGDIATVIRTQWKTNLHIDVDPQGRDGKQYSTDHKNANFFIARAGWYGDYLDTSTFTDKYLGNSKDNSGRWVDQKYDDLCAKATVETDPATRLKLVHDAEDRLLTEAAIIPLYTQFGAYLTHTGVTGIPPAPQQMAMFKAIRNTRK